MAFQIDPNIPLQANKVQFDPAAILMQAQQNGAALEKHRFEMQKLREDYDLAKEQRKQQKAMQMGIASDLAGIQSGSPAQYAPTRFEQTPQRGQMPQGMTGVMMREQGQQMPQPQAFGEEILNGDFRLGGGEVTQEAVAGRQPTYPEMLAIGLKQAMLNKNQDEIFKYAKAIQETEKQATKWGKNPTKGINEKGQPDYFVVNELGQKQFLGVNPYETPKDPKAPVTYTVKNNRVETTYGLDANGKPVVLGRSSLDSPKAAAAERPEHYFPADGLTGDAFLNTLPPQDKARVRAIVRHDMPYPSAAAIRRDPTIARLAEAVWKADENYSDIGYNNKKLSAKSYLPGQVNGKLILSNASALGHMAVLREAYNAMNNGDLKTINEIANRYKVQTGSAPEAVFDAIKGVIGAEVMKSIVPGGGGVVEREDVRETLSRGYSNDQFMGTLGGYESLMKEQYDNMHQDYRRMGLPEAQWPTYLTHEQKKIEAANGGKGSQSSKQDDYKEYVLERGKAYKSGNYDLVRQMDAMAKQDGLIK
jgi:hypothetical protein